MRDLAGDRTAQRVGVFGRKLRVGPAFDFDPQGAAGPAGPCMGVYHSGYRPGRCFGGVDDVGVNTAVQGTRDSDADAITAWCASNVLN